MSETWGLPVKYPGVQVPAGLAETQFALMPMGLQVLTLLSRVVVRSKDDDCTTLNRVPRT